MDCTETKYGFKWGLATIERHVEWKGHIILSVETPRETLQIRVTPTGYIRLDGGGPIKNAKNSKEKP